MYIKYNSLRMLKTLLTSTFYRVNGIGKNSQIMNACIAVLSGLWIYSGTSWVSNMYLPDYFHIGLLFGFLLLCLPTVSNTHNQKSVQYIMVFLKLLSVLSVFWLGFGTPAFGLLFLGNYVWNQVNSAKETGVVNDVSPYFLVSCMTLLLIVPTSLMGIQHENIKEISSNTKTNHPWIQMMAQVFPEYQIAEKVMPPLVNALNDKNLPLNTISQSYDYVVWCSNNNVLMLTTNAVIANRSYTLRTPVSGDNSCQYNVLYPELDMGKTMLAMATKNKDYTSANLDSYMSVNHFGLNGRRVEADALSSSTAQKLTKAIIESNRQLVNASHH